MEDGKALILASGTPPTAAASPLDEVTALAAVPPVRSIGGTGALTLPHAAASATALVDAATQHAAKTGTGLTLVQNNTYIAGGVTSTSTSTKTTNTTTNEIRKGNGRSRDDDDEDEEAEGNGAILVNYPQGSKLGRCFYAKCAHPQGKEIRRDYEANGFGVSYFCCSHSCGGEAIHAECCRKFSFEPHNMGKLIERPCIKCHRILRIRTEVAFLEALGARLYWFWWFLTRVVPALLVAGFAFKLLWFSLVVVGHWPTDTFSNPWLASLDPLTGNPVIATPSFSIAAFRNYTFCKPSSLDWFCPVFKTGCNGMAYCSHGGFSAISLFYGVRIFGFKIRRLPLPIPWIEHGHMWMGAYFIIYWLSWPYLFYRWDWHNRLYKRFTRGFHRTRVESVKRGKVVAKKAGARRK